MFSCPSAIRCAGSGLRLGFAWIEELSTADVRCCVVVVEWVVVFRCMFVELMFVLFVMPIVGAKDGVVVAASARSIKDWRSATIRILINLDKSNLGFWDLFPVFGRSIWSRMH